MIIFQKHGNKHTYIVNLHLVKKRSKHPDTYTYLGVTFEKSGNFNQASLNLKNEAIKATFKMLSLLSTTTHINSHLLTELFDSMIKPIVIYGSKVWASEFLFIRLHKLKTG